MAWPQEPWAALSQDRIFLSDGSFQLTTVDCGTLKMPSGKLVCADPFAGLNKFNNPYVQVPPGTYQVFVTLADLSEEQDGSHLREAYASLLIQPNSKEVKRVALEPTLSGKPSGSHLGPDEYVGFGVDAGTACFADAEAISSGMPDDSNWYEDLFENDKPDCWFNLMDDPTHIRNGVANIQLPLSTRGENLILFHSGWGDGFYPVVGGYDGAGNLVAVHIDFFVVGDE